MQIDAFGVDMWLAGLHEELVSKTYRPAPVIKTLKEVAGLYR